MIVKVMAGSCVLTGVIQLLSNLSEGAFSGGSLKVMAGSCVLTGVIQLLSNFSEGAFSGGSLRLWQVLEYLQV